MVKQIVSLGVLAGLLSACRGEQSLQFVEFVDGFEAPESAAFDPGTNSWYVSNIAGSEPGDGYISLLTRDGDVTARRLISGLDDPKGIRIQDGVLYVSDVTRLVRVDLTNVDAPTIIDVPGSVFLNDVAVHRRTGDVFVTDTLANAIYRVRDMETELLFEDPRLEAPNGLLVDGDSLLIASIGPDLDPTTFTTSGPSRVSRLNVETLELTPVTERIGALDGLERDRADLLVSDFYVGVYRASAGQQPELILENAEYGLRASADIGFDAAGGRLAVPELTGTRVGLFDFERTWF